MFERMVESSLSSPTELSTQLRDGERAGAKEARDAELRTQNEAAEARAAELRAQNGKLRRQLRTAMDDQRAEAPQNEWLICLWMMHAH